MLHKIHQYGSDDEYKAKFKEKLFPRWGHEPYSAPRLCLKINLQNYFDYQNLRKSTEPPNKKTKQKTNNVKIK